ncbi:hypothetical protein HanHA300_Chr17g0663291 [Helianthus annuus]|nr:hypothetical protein HanHA300_Chr17g0663291 [Helianthus annuus]
MYSQLVDYVTKEVYFPNPEVALRKSRIKLLLPQELQDKTQVPFVVLLALRIDQNVVDKYDD